MDIAKGLRVSGIDVRRNYSSKYFGGCEHGSACSREIQRNSYSACSKSMWAQMTGYHNAPSVRGR